MTNERLAEVAKRLVQVDDVDTISRRVDVGLHLRIPALGLASEVNARLQHLQHHLIGRIWKSSYHGVLQVPLLGHRRQSPSSRTGTPVRCRHAGQTDACREKPDTMPGCCKSIHGAMGDFGELSALVALEPNFCTNYLAHASESRNLSGVAVQRKAPETVEPRGNQRPSLRPGRRWWRYARSGPWSSLRSDRYVVDGTNGAIFRGTARRPSLRPRGALHRLHHQRIPLGIGAGATQYASSVPWVSVSTTSALVEGSARIFTSLSLTMTRSSAAKAAVPVVAVGFMAGGCVGSTGACVGAVACVGSAGAPVGGRQHNGILQGRRSGRHILRCDIDRDDRCLRGVVIVADERACPEPNKHSTAGVDRRSATRCANSRSNIALRFDSWGGDRQNRRWTRQVPDSMAAERAQRPSYRCWRHAVTFGLGSCPYAGSSEDRG